MIFSTFAYCSDEETFVLFIYAPDIFSFHIVIGDRCLWFIHTLRFQICWYQLIVLDMEFELVVLVAVSSPCVSI